MKLEKLEARVLCDNGICKNTADYAVEKEDTPKNMRLYLCKSCVKELYRLFWAVLKQKKESN